MARTALALSLLAVLVSHAASAAPPLRVRVEIDGASYAFQRCSLASESQITDLREGDGSIHRNPGRATFPNVVCSRPLAAGNAFFWQWRKQIEHGTVNRKKMLIVFLDPSGKGELARFTVLRAWPVAARIKKFDAPDLPASANDVAMEEVEIAHEGLELE